MSLKEKITNKIEIVRQEPEHVRIKYVWGAVALSMIFILGIWIFSMSTFFKKNPTEKIEEEKTGIEDLQQQLRELKKNAPEKPSIENFDNEISKLNTLPEEQTSTVDTTINNTTTDTNDFTNTDDISVQQYR
jgi:hypothetical protein